MMRAQIAVIDIGKTNAKVAIVDASDVSEVAVVTCPNTVCTGPPYPHVDVEAIWDFLLKALAEFHARYRIDALSITTHGATGGLIAADGSLAAPILDYEHTGPDDVAGDYDALRPSFEETGSPRLPMGLNLGAQFHWQFLQDATLLDRTASVVTYPQYWGYRLSGALSCDVSSLGCHTDLWNPFEARFSPLVERLGIADKMAPARKSTDILGSILPEVAQRTGLKPDTPVYCGIHDSNASLLPHVLRRSPPFSVVSTGTWVIVMTVGGPKIALDPSRDMLINVDARGHPVPSARFMGGREYELILDGGNVSPDAEVLDRVASEGPFLMPAIVPESGPFQGRQSCWVGPEPGQGTPERNAAVSFYLALMAAECLSLTGHEGAVIVEGPFAANVGFCEMLSVATDSPVISAPSATGTSQGAAMLALPLRAVQEKRDSEPRGNNSMPEYRTYAERWRQAVHKL